MINLEEYDEITGLLSRRKSLLTVQRKRLDKKHHKLPANIALGVEDLIINIDISKSHHHINLHVLVPNILEQEICGIDKQLAKLEFDVSGLPKFSEVTHDTA